MLAVDAKDIEQTYQEVTFGRDEPDLMVMNGKVLRGFDPSITHDSYGQPIYDGLVYYLTAKGIYPVNIEEEENDGGH